MEEDTEPQEIMNVVEDYAEAEADIQQEAEPEAEKVTQVPLSALQKERKKRQELEQELAWERKRQQQQSMPEPEDNSKYESATKEDLYRAQHEAMRAFEEKMWIRNNPDKYEKVNELLPEFLKQRPNYASAINEAQNRYEEAFTIMEALTPRQQQALKASPAQKRVAPNSPGGIPKASAMNENVDVMNMSDAEFSVWRKSQKRR